MLGCTKIEKDKCWWRGGGGDRLSVKTLNFYKRARFAMYDRTQMNKFQEKKMSPF